ncbi:hypothetical protein MTO96_046554 [Rhipicephalus appendiculatus]
MNQKNLLEKDASSAYYKESVPHTAVPAASGGGGAHVYLIGEWYPAEGNGTLGALRCPTWTPPEFAYASKTGVCEGSPVEATAKGTEEARDSKTRPVIVPRTELSAYGIDKTTAERLSLSPAPASTTCEANALKLGLMLDWAKYGEKDACSLNIFTDQSQVHEPGVRIAADTTIVPHGESYLITPAAFDGQLSFREAAVFLLTFLPWPWGNMGIALKTIKNGDTAEREQVFTCKISAYGLFDAVQRSILEGPLVSQNHAGLMAVEKTKLNADAMINVSGSEAAPAPVIGVVPSTNDDTVPLLYRCWSPIGYRIEHVPIGATWTNVQLKPDLVICLPDIMILTAIYGGFYKFTASMPAPSIPIGHKLLSAAQFLTAERTFVAWYMWHAMIGLDTGTINSAAHAEIPGRGETDYFDSPLCSSSPHPGEGSWAGQTKKFYTTSTPYPLFATIWNGWMDYKTHKVLTLQQPMVNPDAWWDILHGPCGTPVSVAMFSVVLQPTIPKPFKTNAAKARLGKLKAKSENVGGGAPLVLAKQERSETTTQTSSSRPERCWPCATPVRGPAGYAAGLTTY